MALKDKTTLSTDKNTSYPDNTVGDIEPVDLRGQQQDIIDSTLNLDASTPEQTVAGDVDFTGLLKTNGNVVSAESNVVIVNSAADFPAPVSDVITLAANTIYLITDAIDVGNDRFILSSKTSIIGTDAQICSITSTTALALFTATADFHFKSFKVTASTSTIFACTGGSFESAFIEKFTINSCAAVGTFTDWYSLFWAAGAVVDGGTGLVMSGACNIFILELVEFIIWDNSATAIDFGVATFGTCSIIRCGFQGVGGTGQTAIDLAASSANMNSGKQGRIYDNTFGSTLTNAILNADVSDIQWKYQGNDDGVSNSSYNAHAYMHTTTPTTISVINTKYVINGATNWIIAHDDQWIITTGGRFTYNGLQPKEFLVTMVLNGTSVSGTNVFNHYVGKNGAFDVSSKMSREYASASNGTVSVITTLTMNNGDYIEGFVENISSAQNWSTNICNMLISPTS